MTESEALRWVASRAERWGAETGADWAVAREGELVGRVGLRRLDLVEGVGEAAYWVLPAARGEGVATGALQGMSEWLFSHVGLQRIELFHSTANAASCAVAVGAGFAPEGTKRGSVLHADGWHDMHIHARLAGDA